MRSSLSRRFSRAWDLGLLLPALVLTLLSGLTMVSAAARLNPALAVRHGWWIALGLAASFGVSRFDYRRWSDLAGPAYALALAALLFVLAAGAVRLGATRWLSLFGVSLQPSEPMKLATVWLLARYLAGQPTPLPARALVTSLALAGVPAFLVFIQPDLGSASIFCVIWLGMVWAAGISRRHLAWLAGGLAGLLPLGWHVLKDYQRDRLIVFLNPQVDPLGAGYTIIQSVIAIGSGRLWGRGWLSGTQNQLSFLPERHSDFVFSVIGEEWGFLGCLAVAGLFALLLTRTVHLAQDTSEPYGRLLAVGVFSWLAYQACVNMGMVMGLFPVVGIPLPLVSYGGTAMCSAWIALGFLQSVRRTDRLT
ncbi:MAG: rod shape-determining protein RodA [Omnitrophica WOR_2 bacterium RIFCSPHIGHO2_02_FULL_68_15]|nr:MAG: rod shape-determining protein RodA [Omnitrophica WOR_2 bacterium RIFCSPHIGHO2_02_FULL_68_15]